MVTLGMALTKRLHLAHVNVRRTKKDMEVLRREATALLDTYKEAHEQATERVRVLVAHEQQLESILLRADEQPAGDSPMDVPQPRDANAAATAIQVSMALPTWDGRDAGRAQREAGYDVSHLEDVRFVRGLLALTRRKVHEYEERLRESNGLFVREGGLLEPGAGVDGGQEALASSLHGSAKRASGCAGVGEAALKRPKPAGADMGNGLRPPEATGIPASAADHGDVLGARADAGDVEDTGEGSGGAREGPPAHAGQRGVEGGATTPQPAPAAGVRRAPATEEAVQRAPSVQLSAEQLHVVRLVREGRNVFFTGPAGTGKSTTLRAVVAQLHADHGEGAVFVTASTGARPTSALRAGEAAQPNPSHVLYLLRRRYRFTPCGRHHTSPVRWRRLSK